MPTIRPAEPADLPDLTAIYNHHVRTTPVTFDVEPYTVEARRTWFEQFAPTGRHRLLVAVEDGEVAGYAGTTTFRPKAAYAPSVETTVYVRPEAQGRGLGRALYAALFAALEGEDVHRFLAGVTLPNPASVALHRAVGFTEVGVFREVGRKFGRFWDVLWLERPKG